MNSNRYFQTKVLVTVNKLSNMKFKVGTVVSDVLGKDIIILLGACIRWKQVVKKLS